MIIHGKDVTGDRVEQADVVIIGSGAGGGTMANELTAAGLSVVVLEEGGHFTKSDFHQREDEAFGRMYGGRGLATTQDQSVNVLWGKLVGGTTVFYWADSFRTPDDRLHLWMERHGLRECDPATMKPYFDHVEKLVNVQIPPDRLVNENNRLLAEGARKLGWEVSKVPGARKGGECTGCGHAMQGCSYDAKQSQLVTNIPRALSRGAKLYADCRAERVLVEAGKAAGVAASVMDRATGQPKATLTVKAKVVVLAAGGVGSPVFLLRAGQANSSGMVGKNLYLNPSPMTFSRFDHPVRMWESVPATWHVDRFRRARYDASGKLVEGGYLLMANNLQPGAAAAVLPGFGAQHRAWMEAYEYLAGTYAILDDEHPGELVLDEVNKPVFKYSVRDNDLLKCRDFLKKSAQVMLAAGAKEVLIPDAKATVIRSEAELETTIAEVDLRPGSILYAAPHPMGTCRMGEDPRTSVVNSRCESHDLPNLFLADASIFPTSISVDPSISIMAFAAKTATHVIDRVKSQNG